MTVTILSSYPIQIVSGDRIQFDSSPVPSITTADVYSPDHPTESVGELLSNLSVVQIVGKPIIDATVAGQTSTYSVPVRRNFLPTAVIFALTAVSGSGSPPEINVGYTGSFNQYIDGTRVADRFATFISPRQLLLFRDFDSVGAMGGLYVCLLSAGRSVVVNVVSPASFPVYEVMVCVLGFEFGSSAVIPLPMSRYGLGPYGIGPYASI